MTSPVPDAFLQNRAALPQTLACASGQAEGPCSQWRKGKLTEDRRLVHQHSYSEVSLLRVLLNSYEDVPSLALGSRSQHLSLNRLLNFHPCGFMVSHQNSGS